MLEIVRNFERNLRLWHWPCTCGLNEFKLFNRGVGRAGDRIISHTNINSSSSHRAVWESSFNGTPITYDALGNPINYYTGDRFTWQGRRLVKVEDLLNTLTFTYGDNGIRQSKTVNGVITNTFSWDSVALSSAFGLAGGLIGVTKWGEGLENILIGAGLGLGEGSLGEINEWWQSRSQPKMVCLIPA